MRAEDKILNFLSFNGPSLPIKIAKNIKEELLITSAYLSELAQQRKVKISNLKIGTSPLYYLPGQDSQLVNFTGGLNRKDHDVLMALKLNGVLKETDLDLLAKVALRSLKDFAVPIHVGFLGKRELFWKWHTLSEIETNQKVTNYLTGIKTTSNEEEKENLEKRSEEVETQKPQVHDQEAMANFNEQRISVQPQKENNQGYPPNTAKEEPRQEINQSYPPNTVQEERVREKVIERNPISQEEVNVTERIPNISVEPTIEVKLPDSQSQLMKEAEIQSKVTHNFSKEAEIELVESHEKLVEKQTPSVEEKSKKSLTKKDKEIEKQESIVSKLKSKVTKKKSGGEFLDSIENYFQELNVDIESHEVIRKNKEVNFAIMVPSVIGKLNYFCKAKSKNRCDEKDLSAAYMEAQVKKRPLLFLYTGDLTKKAKAMMEVNAFENAMIKRMDDGTKN
jgi:hypothetical protein